MSEIIPVGQYSQLGEKAIEEMSINESEYIRFMKFHGRLFKQPVSVTLEFYVNKPDAQFIATEKQWNNANMSIRQGCKGIRFYEPSKGSVETLYDFQEVNGEFPPKRWGVTNSNVDKIRRQLNLSSDKPFYLQLDDAATSSMDDTSIIYDLGLENLSGEDKLKFRNSYHNMIQLMIAGRLETSGALYQIQPDNFAFSVCESNLQRLALLSAASITARKALLGVENAFTTLRENEIMQKKEKNNELQRVDNAVRRRETERGGRGLSSDSERTAEKRHNINEAGEERQSDGMAVGSGSQKSEVGGMVPGSDNGGNSVRGSEDSSAIPVQSDERTVRAADSVRADNGGTADRNIRENVDEEHGEELPGEGGIHGTETQLSDGGERSGQQSGRTVSDTERQVRQESSEPTPDGGIRSDASVGNNEENGDRTRDNGTDSSRSDNDSGKRKWDRLDLIFDHPENERLEWVYYNPDSLSGGQLVINNISYEMLKDAFRYGDEVNAENPMDYIMTSADQKLVDITDSDFSEISDSYLESDNAVFTGNTGSNTPVSEFLHDFGEKIFASEKSSIVDEYRSTLPETRFTSLSDQQKSDYDLHPYVEQPVNGAWGEINRIYAINNGIFQVSNEHHSGIMIKADIAKTVLSTETQDAARKENDWYYYESFDASIPKRELIDKGLFADIDEYYRTEYGMKTEDIFEKNNERINENIIRFSSAYWNSRINAIENKVDTNINDSFELYQLKSGEELHYHRFTNYDLLHKEGNSVEFKNYDRVYEDELPNGTTLESIYTRFNIHRPDDFRGHSLSVSDIIVTHKGDETKAFYVDSYGFKEVPEFLNIQQKSEIVDEFRKKTEENYKPVTNLSANAMENDIKADIISTFSENGIDAEVGRVVISGSRCRGLEREDSDLDVVVEIKSDLKEDALFNILNENPVTYNSVTLDINPIKADETGTLEEYLPVVEEYLSQRKKQLDEDLIRSEEIQNISDEDAERMAEYENTVNAYLNYAENCHRILNSEDILDSPDEMKEILGGNINDCILKMDECIDKLKEAPENLRPEWLTDNILKSYEDASEQYESQLKGIHKKLLERKEKAEEYLYSKFDEIVLKPLAWDEKEFTADAMFSKEYFSKIKDMEHPPIDENFIPIIEDFQNGKKVDEELGKLIGKDTYSGSINEWNPHISIPYHVKKSNEGITFSAAGAVRYAAWKEIGKSVISGFHKIFADGLKGILDHAEQSIKDGKNDYKESDIISYKKEIAEADELMKTYIRNYTVLDIPKYDLKIDLSEIQSIDIERTSLSYAGGLDEEGHERKDNYEEKTTSESYYVSGEFMELSEIMYSSENGLSSTDSAESVSKDIEHYLDESIKDENLKVYITDNNNRTEIDANSLLVNLEADEVDTNVNDNNVDTNINSESTPVDKQAELIKDIMRGSGFENGKIRINKYYTEQKPKNKDFADFLKHEYGIGGHSANDPIAFVDHDAKGIHFTLTDANGRMSDNKFTFNWSAVAKQTAELIDSEKYFTEKELEKINRTKFTSEKYGFTVDLKDIKEIVLSRKYEHSTALEKFYLSDNTLWYSNGESSPARVDSANDVKEEVESFLDDIKGSIGDSSRTGDFEAYVIDNDGNRTDLHKPLEFYLYNPKYASEHGEREIYFADKKETEKTEKDIYNILNQNSTSAEYGQYIDIDATLEILNKRYVPDRIAFALANRLQNLDFDGRISDNVKEWTKTVLAQFPEKNSPHGSGYLGNVHPVILNDLTQKFMETYVLIKDRENVDTNINSANEVDTNINDEIYEANMDTLNNIKSGDILKLQINGEISTFRVSKVTDDFFMSMERLNKDLSSYVGPDSSAVSYAGNWKEQILKENSNYPIIRVAEENVKTFETIAKTSKKKAEKNFVEGQMAFDFNEVDTNINELDKAKSYINDFCQSEYGTDADFSDITKINLAYATDEENGLEIQVSADIEKYRMIYEYDGKIVREEQYNSLDDMNENVLSVLDYGDMISLSDDEKSPVIAESVGNEDDFSDIDTQLIKENLVKGDSEFIEQVKADVDTNINEVKQRTVNDIKPGDKYRYRNEEYTVTDQKGIYPDDVVVTRQERSYMRDHWVTFETTSNVDKFELHNKGEYLGNEVDTNINDSNVDTNINENIIKDLSEPVVQQTHEEPKKRNTRSNQLYKLFTEAYPEIVNGEHTHERYGREYVEDGNNDAIEPLSIENLGDFQYDADTYSFMYWYVQNGDVMRDPDYVFTLDHENQELHVMEYQIDGVPPVGTYYNSVVQSDGTIDKKLQASLESSFLSTLKNTIEYKRNLSEYTNKDGIVTELEENIQRIESNTEEITDESAVYRKTLNDFSEKHGLGELNIEKTISGFAITEKYSDGKTESLWNISNQYVEKPLTEEEVQNALISFEKRAEFYGEKISETEKRQNFINEHGEPVSELPPVQSELPEIKYADNPRQKITDNILAIQEIQRIEQCLEYGRPPFTIGNGLHNVENSMNTLRKYSGWGGLPMVFDESYKLYDYQRNKLKELLTPEEYNAAKASTLTSHYTPQVIIDEMYKTIQNMGLPKNSRILEPACGTGNFISRMPTNIGKGGIVGVELDTTTSKIAKYLTVAKTEMASGNGKEKEEFEKFSEKRDIKIINSGFENSGLENNSFDLVIGNVPFGDYKMIDPDYTKDWLIHDAFFRKGLDKVAPGGIVAFVTSSGTLDKKNPKVREYLATNADLIGAVRLPNNAFSDAGTPVTSDIIFLQKRKTPLKPFEPKPDWCYTSQIEVEKTDKKHEGEKFTAEINSYFAKNPQMILGTMKQTSFYDRLTCVPDESKSLKEQLEFAMKQLNAKISIERREKSVLEKKGYIEPWGKNFTYQVKDDKVYYNFGNSMEEEKGNDKKIAKLKALCELRDITRELLDKQQTYVTDEELIPLRNKLNAAYDKFVKDNGNIISSTNKKLFSKDSDYPILAALEKVNAQTQAIEKADIFSVRTVNPVKEITAAGTVEEALQYSLDKRGKVDIPYMTMLLHSNGYEDTISSDEYAMDMQSVADQLIEKNLCYRDPEKLATGKPFAEYVEKSEYLCGDVVRKLHIAETMAEKDSSFERNAEDLKNVIPEPIGASEIIVDLGCPWIDTDDYEKFICELSGRDLRSFNHSVSYSDVTGKFTIDGTRTKNSYYLNTNEKSTYGTDSMNMYAIVENLMNQKRIQVFDYIPNPNNPSTNKAVVNVSKTQVAQSKAKEIKKKFSEWIFADESRKEKYVKRYNERFNCIVGRSYDGSHLTFSGMANGFKLRPHQLDCVARTIYGGNTLAAHCVGAGKSAVISSSVMKKKELGLINKACVVVPKPLTEQTEREWRTAFPDAKLLVVDNKDLSDEKRREVFTARVATGNYDAVIMSQEQFEKLPMSPDYQVEYLEKKKAEAQQMLSERKKASRGKDPTVKELENVIKITETRIKILTDPKSKSKAKDSLLNFEQLGFDYLVVDEAHAYKNGFVSTKMGDVAGVTTRESGRAADMQMKCEYFNTHPDFGDGHILMATGTPVSNSMTELYIMTRYLKPQALENCGCARFDDWAATFGQIKTQNKKTATGELKMKTCFHGFKNTPELMKMYKEFADIRSLDQLDYLNPPKVKGGKPQIVEVEASPEQREMVKDFAKRGKAIASGRVRPDEDNLLKITGEARLVGLCNKAVASVYEKNGWELPENFDINDKTSKVDKCIENVYSIYKDKYNDNAVQLIFSDIAVNSDDGKFSVYEYIKNELIEKGVPEDEIIFAPKSDAKNRTDIFRDINEAKYRIVIASTNTLGTGANIQKNLYALHHTDIPWRPGDFAQREGRIIRQGNLNDEVQIFNYVTKGTLDSYLYQGVTDKARGIAQLWNDNYTSRTTEDIDEKVLTFGELEAAAEGNPKLRQYSELKNKIDELRVVRSEYNHETSRVERNLKSYLEQRAVQKSLLAGAKADFETAKSMMTEGKLESITITNHKGESISERGKINEFLHEKIMKRRSEPLADNPDFKIGNFTITVKATTDRDRPIFSIKGERSAAYRVEASISDNADNCQRLMNFFEKSIEKQIESAENEIERIDSDEKLAKERIEIKFPQEDEFNKAVEDFEKLEKELSSGGYLDNGEEIAGADEIADRETEKMIEENPEKFSQDNDEDIDYDEDDMTAEDYNSMTM